jgi:hypothetical protein
MNDAYSDAPVAGGVAPIGVVIATYGLPLADPIGRS